MFVSRRKFAELSERVDKLGRQVDESTAMYAEYPNAESFLWLGGVQKRAVNKALQALLNRLGLDLTFTAETVGLREKEVVVQSDKSADDHRRHVEAYFKNFDTAMNQMTATEMKEHRRRIEEHLDRLQNAVSGKTKELEELAACLAKLRDKYGDAIMTALGETIGKGRGKK